MKQMAKILSSCALGFLLIFLGLTIPYFLFICFGVLAIVVELTIILKVKPVVFTNLAFREDKDASFARNRHGLDFFSASGPGT